MAIHDKEYGELFSLPQADTRRPTLSPSASRRDKAASLTWRGKASPSSSRRPDLLPDLCLNDAEDVNQAQDALQDLLPGSPLHNDTPPPYSPQQQTVQLQHPCGVFRTHSQRHTSLQPRQYIEPQQYSAPQVQQHATPDDSLELDGVGPWWDAELMEFGRQCNVPPQKSAAPHRTSSQRAWAEGSSHRRQQDGETRDGRVQQVSGRSGGGGGKMAAAPQQQQQPAQQHSHTTPAGPKYLADDDMAAGMVDVMADAGALVDDGDAVPLAVQSSMQQYTGRTIAAVQSEPAFLPASMLSRASSSRSSSSSRKAFMSTLSRPSRNTGSTAAPPDGRFSEPPPILQRALRLPAFVRRDVLSEPAVRAGLSTRYISNDDMAAGLVDTLPDPGTHLVESDLPSHLPSFELRRSVSRRDSEILSHAPFHLPSFTARHSSKGLRRDSSRRDSELLRQEWPMMLRSESCDSMSLSASLPRVPDGSSSSNPSLSRHRPASACSVTAVQLTPTSPPRSPAMPSTSPLRFSAEVVVPADPQLLRTFSHQHLHFSKSWLYESAMLPQAEALTVEDTKPAASPLVPPVLPQGNRPWGDSPTHNVLVDETSGTDERDTASAAMSSADGDSTAQRLHAAGGGRTMPRGASEVLRAGGSSAGLPSSPARNSWSPSLPPTAPSSSQTSMPHHPSYQPSSQSSHPQSHQQSPRSSSHQHSLTEGSHHKDDSSHHTSAASITDGRVSLPTTTSPSIFQPQPRHSQDLPLLLQPPSQQQLPLQPVSPPPPARQPSQKAASVGWNKINIFSSILSLFAPKVAPAEDGRSASSSDASLPTQSQRGVLTRPLGSVSSPHGIVPPGQKSAPASPSASPVAAVLRRAASSSRNRS